MSRESRIGRHRQAGELDEKLLETIVEDVIKAASMAHDDWWALSQSPLVPLAIPISAGREYRVTQAGAEAAHKLTAKNWEEREKYRQTISREAFDRLSFRAIGKAIQNAHARLLEETGDAEGSDEVDRAFYKELAADFRKTLDRLGEEARTDVDQHIPCTLFHEDQMVPAFSVGPVEFRPRADWMDCFVKDAEARNIVDRVERGELTIDDVRRRAVESESRFAARQWPWDATASDPNASLALARPNCYVSVNGAARGALAACAGLRPTTLKTRYSELLEWCTGRVGIGRSGHRNHWNGRSGTAARRSSTFSSMTLAGH